MFGFDIDWNKVIVFASAGAAFVSFAVFAVPLLIRTERKERYRAIIEKKRKALYAEAKAELDAPRRSSRDTKAKDQKHGASSMAMFFRIQKLAGETAKQARVMMQMAGIRAPAAPLVYLGMRIILPVVFSLLAISFMAAADKEIHSAMKLSILLGAVVIGFFLPRILIKNIADKRQLEISLTFPDALDMILICVQGGIGVEGAITRIAETVSEHSAVLAEELGILCAELGMLNDRRAAFQGFANRVGSGSAKSFATAMLQAEQYGTSVSKALRVLSEDLRDQRMAEAERKAASLPPKLTVPMILFFLPALFVTILGPAFLRSQ